MDPQARDLLPRQTWHWPLDSLRERTNLAVAPRLPGGRSATGAAAYRLALRDRVEDELPRVTVPALLVSG